MPNWCYNHLTVQAEGEWNEDPEVIEENQTQAQAELLKFKKENFKDLGEDNDTQVLTFNAAVPMPDTLRITSGTTTDRAIAYLLAKTKDDYTEIDKIAGYQFAPKHYSFKKGDEINLKRLKILKVMEKEVTKSEIEEGEKALLNEKMYGHKDWYNWSIDNWGTKWDAGESETNHDTENELHVSFDTAWSPPTPWLQKVTEKYKLLKFTLEYTEEGMGFEGKTFARNGEMQDNCMQVNYPDRFFD